MGDMFHKKTDEILSGMPSIFCIADDILIAGFDKQGKDHDATLDKILRLCRQVNLKPNKDKFPFRCSRIPFFS